MANQDNLAKLAPERLNQSGFNEARDDAMTAASAEPEPYAKSFAPHSRQITMPAPHHLIFYMPDALPEANQQCQS